MLRKLFALLLVACVLVGAFAESGSPAPGSSQSSSEGPSAPGSDSHQESDSWQSSERKFEYEVSSQEFKAKAGFYSTDLQVRRGIKFEGKVDQEGLRLYARFYNRETDSSSMYSVKIRVRDMIEYVPAADNSTGYTDGDTVVRSLTSGWVWNDVKQDTVSANSTYARQLSVSTKDGAFGAVVKFNIPADNSSIAVSANDMKIDFIVDNAALKAAGWLTNEKSLIALKGVIQTGSNLEHRMATSGSEVEGVEVETSNAATSFAAVQWTNFIECGPVARRVKVASSKLIDDSSNSENHESSDEDNGSSRANVIYWSFLNDKTVSGSEKCIWDPAVKVQSAASRASTFGLIALAFLGAFVALFL